MCGCHRMSVPNVGMKEQMSCSQNNNSMSMSDDTLHNYSLYRAQVHELRTSHTHLLSLDSVSLMWGNTSLNCSLIPLFTSESLAY